MYIKMCNLFFLTTRKKRSSIYVLIKNAMKKKKYSKLMQKRIGIGESQS